MHSAMFEVAKQINSVPLNDLVAVYHFDQPNQPTLIKLPVGFGAKLKSEMDGFARALMMELSNFVAADSAAVNHCSAACNIAC